MTSENTKNMMLDVVRKCEADKSQFDVDNSSPSALLSFIALITFGLLAAATVALVVGVYREGFGALSFFASMAGLKAIGQYILGIIILKICVGHAKKSI